MNEYSYRATQDLLIETLFRGSNQYIERLGTIVTKGYCNTGSHACRKVYNSDFCAKHAHSNARTTLDTGMFIRMCKFSGEKHILSTKEKACFHCKFVSKRLLLSKKIHFASQTWHLFRTETTLKLFKFRSVRLFYEPTIDYFIFFSRSFSTSHFEIVQPLTEISKLLFIFQKHTVNQQMVVQTALKVFKKLVKKD